MENWPRIPKSLSGSVSPRSGQSGLPSPGTVIMASVEEELGDGMYALRWAGNRIAVSSRVALSPGQSLILKSELSPEGKPTLVVQGPAIPNPGEILGPVIYHAPQRGRAGRDEQTQHSVQAGQGEKSGQAVGGAAASAATGALGIQRPASPASLLGLVLEPLPDIPENVLLLLDELTDTEEEKEPQAEEKKGEAGEKQAETAEKRQASGSGKTVVTLPAGDRPPMPARPIPSEGATAPSPSPETKPAQAPTQPSGTVPQPENAASDKQSPAPEMSTPETRPASRPQAEASADAGPPAAASATNPSSPQLSGVVAHPENAAQTGFAMPEASPPVTGAAPPQPQPGDEAHTRPAAEHSASENAVAPSPARPEPTVSQSLTAVASAAHGGASGSAAHGEPTEIAPPRPAKEGSEDAAPSRPPVELRPEVVVKEALTQLVKAAELPLASPAADSRHFAPSGKVPEAIADKAADILLRAAGVTSDPETREAARALLENNVPIDRQNVHALAALAAGSEGVDREAILKAAARLAARELPLAAPLAAGLADVMGRGAGVDELLDSAGAALSLEGEEVAAAVLPEAKPLVDAARNILDMLRVDLDRPDAALALERYVSTFGREALAKALALVEMAAQTTLEGHPLLPKIDQAMTALLALLGRSAAGGQGGGVASPAPGATTEPPAAQDGVSGGAADSDIAASPSGEESPDDAKAADAEKNGEPAAKPASRETAAQPRPPTGSAVNAYLRAPKAFPGLDALHLPPMPAVAKLPPATQGGVPPDSPAAKPDSIPEPAAGGTAGEKEARPAETPPAPSPTQPGKGQFVEIRPETEAFWIKPGVVLQHPGLNRPEMELLRPDGFVDRLLSLARAADEAPGKVKSEAETLARDLLSKSPEKAEKALRELASKPEPLLRETAARIGRMEAELLRNDPVVSRLADAASALRDLGRQLLAVKAENLAGQNRDPGVMLAEVPFKLADDAGDGRMQMFYRRSKRGGDGWTSRVILDLNTTGMGPVLGDMRFFGQDMVLNMFVEKAEAAEFLGLSADELAAGLLEKGFRLKSRFMVLPPPPPAPEIRAERPEIAGETAAVDSPVAAGTRRRGRLDIKG